MLKIGYTMYIRWYNKLMRSVISQWGNSLGLRIPKTIAEEFGIEEGAQVEIQIQSGAIIIHPVNKNLSDIRKLVKDIDIGKLSKKVNRKNRHNLEDDCPVGKEIW